MYFGKITGPNPAPPLHTYPTTLGFKNPNPGSSAQIKKKKKIPDQRAGS